ncbi:hypothetical protein M426DRAFT_143020 [Hypoxylon sp. CI-4A]|nr:hypothetical protein M426DRAFT_143020 [Hypoxylon sp. CI-4A]
MKSKFLSPALIIANFFFSPFSSLFFPRLLLGLILETHVPSVAALAAVSHEANRLHGPIRPKRIPVHHPPLLSDDVVGVEQLRILVASSHDPTTSVGPQLVAGLVVLGLEASEQGVALAIILVLQLVKCLPVGGGAIQLEYVGLENLPCEPDLDCALLHLGVPHQGLVAPRIDQQSVAVGVAHKRDSVALGAEVVTHGYLGGRVRRCLGLIDRDRRVVGRT